LKKSFVVFACLVVIAAQSAVAQNARPFSFGVNVGTLVGNGEEFVYRSSKHDSKLIELLWGMAPLIYAGENVSYVWQKNENRNKNQNENKSENRLGFFASGSIKLGFPATWGIMEDRDWILNSYPLWLTHYSVHDNYAKKAILFDASFGVSFPVFEKFILKPYLSYMFMNFEWMALGGSFLYPESNDYFNNKPGVVTYGQIWNIVSPALAFYGEFNPYFDIELSIKVSPLIFISTKDKHILRDLIITDKMFGGLFVEPGLVFTFKPVRNLTIALSAAYRNISFVYGDSVYDGLLDEHNHVLPPQTFKDIAGAGYSVFDFGLVARYSMEASCSATRMEN
jgi:outer membrane protease